MALKNTLRGLMHNYNCFREDKNNEFTKDDFNIFIICDGYERIPESFKEYARNLGILNETNLEKRGFMERNSTGILKMKEIDNLMDPSVPKHQVPLNLLHLWQIKTSDFGLNEKFLERRQVNLFFGLKQKNDGKVNSHKWFY